jgi:hypothetical protein
VLCARASLVSSSGVAMMGAIFFLLTGMGWERDMILLLLARLDQTEGTDLIDVFHFMTDTTRIKIKQTKEAQNANSHQAECNQGL